MNEYRWTPFDDKQLLANQYGVFIETKEGWQPYPGMACVGLELIRLAASVQELESLTYVGEHHFPDLTWKARCEEQHARLARLDAMLASEEPPEGLARALSDDPDDLDRPGDWREGSFSMDIANDAWRWLRDTLGSDTPMRHQEALDNERAARDLAEIGNLANDALRSLGDVEHIDTPVLDVVRSLADHFKLAMAANANLMRKLAESRAQQNQFFAADALTRLARLDTLLASEEPPAGICRAVFEDTIRQHPMDRDPVTAAWRWIRDTLRDPAAHDDGDQPAEGSPPPADPEPGTRRCTFTVTYTAEVSKDLSDQAAADWWAKTERAEMRAPGGYSLSGGPGRLVLLDCVPGQQAVAPPDDYPDLCPETFGSGSIPRCLLPRNHDPKLGHYYGDPARERAIISCRLIVTDPAKTDATPSSGPSDTP